MSAEIVNFPKLRMPIKRPNPQEGQAELQEHRRELIRKLRSAAENPKAKFERDDEIAPAQAIDRLIGEAKTKKITQLHIREALSKRDPTIRHLERLRVDHTVSPAEAKKKAANDLIRKIQPYVRVLDVLAEALGHSPDAVIFEAFRETAFCRPVTIPIDDPAAHLNWLLHEMTDWVIRSQELSAYLQELRRVEAGYDPTTEEFLYGDLGAEYQQAYEGSVDWCLTVHAVPAAPLVRVHRATFAGPLDVEKTRVASKACPRTQVAGICNIRNAYRTDVHPLGRTEVVSAEIALFTDIRLAIAPRTRSGDLGPLFEIRSYVELKTDGTNRPLTFDLSSFPLSARNDVQDGELNEFVGSVAAQFDDGWRRITGFGKRGWKLKAGKYSTNDTGKIDPASPIGPADRDPEWFGGRLDAGIVFDPLIGEGGSEWAVYWSPANPVTVNCLMQLLSSPPGERSWQWLCETTGPEEKPTAFRFFNAGCKEFEMALYTGAIEGALAAECRRLKVKLTECTDKARAMLEQQTTTVLARWRNTE